MRNDSNALKFDTGVMALAMPTESAFTKAAEGISNVGKVFNDVQDRAQARELNALKMDVANEELTAKKFENTNASEKWDLTKTNLLAERRANLAKAFKTEIDGDIAHKAFKESGMSDTFRSHIPIESLLDPKTGKISNDISANKRNELVSAGGDSAKYIHLYDGYIASLKKDELERDKSTSDIAHKNALAEKTKVEMNTIIPESKAKINSWNASANSANSTAAYNNVKTILAPKEMEVELGKLDVSRKNSETDRSRENRLVAEMRLKKIMSDPSYYKNIDGFDKMSSKEQNKYKQIHEASLGGTITYPKIIFDKGKGYMGGDTNYRLAPQPKPKKDLRSF